jgi:glutathione S-transferase
MSGRRVGAARPVGRLARAVTGLARGGAYRGAMFILPSTAASIVRAPVGHRVGALGPRPARPLELYEFEACPYCRKVREALCMLDLEVVIRPAPHGGTRFRPEAIARGGKAQFPLLIDPNTGDTLYESDAIIRHLYARYGAGVGAIPRTLRLGPIGDALSGAASALRLPHGRRAVGAPGPAPAQLLELWSFESSPYSRAVREQLSELELPYLLHNLGRGSARRAAFKARHGKVQVPYLEDPNTGVAMFESRDILAYLRATYA